MENLQKLKKVLELLDQPYVKTSDLKDIFAMFLKVAGDMRKQFNKEISQNGTTTTLNLQKSLKSLETSIQKKIIDTEKKSDSGMEKIVRDLLKAISIVEAKIPDVPAAQDLGPLEKRIDNLEQKEPEEETGIQTRDKLESLPEGEKLGIDAIQDLEKRLEEAGKNNSDGANRSGAGAFHLLADVDMSGIVAGQVAQWDGNRWIPVTITASGTSVFGEDLTSQGPGTNFTIANTPTAGTLRVYRGGAYQNPNNYTLTVASLVLNVALSTGEELLVDYTY